METVEIKYFLETARQKSVRKAAETIGISPSAISKAIGRLEEELETKLVEKVGRNLALTQAGKKLEAQGAEFLALEKRIIEEHSSGQLGSRFKIVGPELPLSYWGIQLTNKISSLDPDSRMSFEVTSNQDGLDMVNSYKADLAIYTSKKSLKIDNSLMKELGTVSFKTFASKDHPLAKKRSVSVDEVLSERFAVTNSSALALVNESSTDDGWRDDKLTRKNVLFTDSLKSLDSLVLEGLAISYLPDFYGTSLGLKEIKIVDCPYSCKLKIYLCRNKYGLDELWKKLKF